MGNVNKVIYDNTFSISLIMLKKILIKAILELIATYMEVFKNRVWMFILDLYNLYIYIDRSN